MTIEDTMARLRTVDRPTLVVEPDPGSPDQVAILPGSFDPITIAHTALAEAALLWAESVVLVYSVRTIAKEAEPPLLTEPQRLRQLRQLVGGRHGLSVGLCSHGLLVDQVRAAHDRFPASALGLVIGSDKVLQLLHPDWYADRDEALDWLFAHARVLFAVREGEREATRTALDGNTRWQGGFTELAVPPEVAAVSSRSVRSLLRGGQDVTHLVPAAVVPGLQALGVL